MMNGHDDIKEPSSAAWGMDDTPLGQRLRRQAARYGEQIALRHRVSGEWEQLTYAQLGAQAEQAARALLALGVGEVSRLTEAWDFAGEASPLVGIFSANRMEAVVADYACALCRAVALPLYPAITAEDFNYIVAHSGVQILLVDDWARYRKVLALLKDNETLRHIVVIDPEVRLKKDERLLSWADFMALGREEPAEQEARLARAQSEDVAALNYTPGTTGAPKGVLLTHQALQTAAATLGGAEPPAAEEVRLSLLPLAHPLERASVYLTHQCGGRVDLCHDPEAMVACLQESQPHYLNSLPRLWEKVHSTLLEGMTLAKGYRQRFFRRALAVGGRYHHCLREDLPISPWLRFRYNIAYHYLLIKIQAGFGGRLKLCYCLGAALDPVAEEFFLSAGIALLPVYSLTEYPVAALAAPSRPGFGTCGRPAARVAPAGTELLLQGPGQALGYYREPQRTAAAFDRQGFHSGDNGFINAAGEITVLGRIINDPVHNAPAPEQIEKRLKGDYYIDEIVAGVDDQDGQPVLTALIAPNLDGLRFRFARRGREFADEAELLADPAVYRLYEDIVAAAVPELKLTRLALLPTALTVESGALNPLLLLRRQAVREQYAHLPDAPAPAAH